MTLRGILHSQPSGEPLERVVIQALGMNMS